MTYNASFSVLTITGDPMRFITTTFALTLLVAGCFSEQEPRPIACSSTETCVFEVGEGSVCLAGGVCSQATPTSEPDGGTDTAPDVPPDTRVDSSPSPDTTGDTVDDTDTGVSALPVCRQDEPQYFCRCEQGAFACGTDTGECARGIRLCLTDEVTGEGHVMDDCLAATRGATCATDSDCGAGAFCVSETIGHLEDLTDDCYEGTEPVCQLEGCPQDCERRVCRTPLDGGACDTDADCLFSEACIEGTCRTPRVGPIAELCNGLDDSCNGRIDDDAERTSICSTCPFGMALYQYSSTSFLCIDQYEASLPAPRDGVPDDMYSTSRPGVTPHTSVTPQEATELCQASPYMDLFPLDFSQAIVTKRLCRSFEIGPACSGVPSTASESDYPYGDTFVEGACADATRGQLQTGALESCERTVDLGGGALSVADISGNVAEWVIGAGDTYYAAGGSYLDSDPNALMCGALVPEADVPAGAAHVGFRCCTPQRTN